jgi:hypothetical protein
MDKKKIQQAFGRIKKEVDILKSDVEKNKKLAQLNDEIKLEIETIKSFNLEGFTKNLENEFIMINKMMKEFGSRFNHNIDDFEKLSSKLKKYHNELVFVKKKLQDYKKSPEEVKKDLELEFAIKLEEFKNYVRTDITSVLKEVEMVKVDLQGDSGTITRKEFEFTIKEVGDTLSEKIDLQIAKLKNEMTDRIARVYDRYFAEVSNIKEDIKSIKQILRDNELNKMPDEKKKGIRNRISKFFNLDDESVNNGEFKE